MRVYFHNNLIECIQVDEIKSIWSYKEHNEDTFSFLSFESFDGWTYTSEKIDDCKVKSILETILRNGYVSIHHIIFHPEEE